MYKNQENFLVFRGIQDFFVLEEEKKVCHKIGKGQKNMPNFQLFNVVPKLPEELKFLETLTYDIWWCWHPAAVELFRRIRPDFVANYQSNARDCLNSLTHEELQRLAKDTAFLDLLKEVENEYTEEMKKSAADFPAKGEERKVVAYFSLEYGLHESIRLYSGGLGILAGDHLKSASDMCVPLVGVGLLYHQGYFRQTLDATGWQIEKYPENSIPSMPITRTCDQDGKPISITLRLLNNTVKAIVWTLKVGNIHLLLLDTEIPENPPEFRQLTWQLYGGDKRMRLQQELLLGMGGFQAVVKAGYTPTACHLNEGHAAFLSLARIGHMIDQGFEEDAAIEYVSRTNIFTTHTPVPAGNETFDIGLLRPYLEALQPVFKVDVNRVLNWGRALGDNGNELSMTVLGLRMSSYGNGVSRLHGEVARQMWRHLWPNFSAEEIPIGHITNGVHVPSWVSPACREVYNLYLGTAWDKNTDEDYLTTRIDMIPNDELWQAHEMNRARLIRYVRSHYSEQLKQRGANWQRIQDAANILQPDVLTIGFARRFATYKRATLLLRDRERLKRLLANEKTPVQILFAGKAHPADDAGKSFIRDIIQFAEQNNLTHRLLFLENYDISLARHLVQGVDVWLNNPLRPQEASGTSGMKASINGVLNCSILDGWWVEGYEAYADAGWAIPSIEDGHDADARDTYESQALFNIIENEIIPCYYERNSDGFPRRWIEKMKASIKMSLWQYSSNRMVSDYVRKFYQPAMAVSDALLAENNKAVKELVEERRKYDIMMPKMKVQFPKISALNSSGSYHAGDVLQVSCEVTLSDVALEDVTVQVCYGQVDAKNSIYKNNVQEMTFDKDLGQGHYLFKTEIICKDSGRFGMTSRVLPKNANRWTSHMPGFIVWAE